MYNLSVNDSTVKNPKAVGKLKLEKRDQIFTSPSRIIVTLLGTIGLVAGSVSDVQAADAKKGEVLYKKCMACHGKDGMGNKGQRAPMIAGQYDWYIVSQMNAIINQERVTKGAKKMYPQVKNLKKKEIEDLAAYVSKLSRKKPNS